MHPWGWCLCLPEFSFPESVTLPESPVHRRCFVGALGAGGPCSIGSQPASPRQHLWVFKGCLCPHGGSVKSWSGEGVCSLPSAQGHVWCRVGNNPAVGPLFSPLGLRTAFGCGFFPFKHTGSAARSQDGALGWGWVTAVLGLPSQNTVSNLPPRSLPGDAGGRLGGRQNLPAGAVQRWRFPCRQLHFHSWDRLQGKCWGVLGPCQWQVSDGFCSGVTKCCSNSLKPVILTRASSSWVPQRWAAFWWWWQRCGLVVRALHEDRQVRPLHQVLGQVVLGQIFAQGKYFPKLVSMFLRICCVLKQNKQSLHTHAK